MADKFDYFGYKYEIVDDDKKEVALIGAGNAPERCVVPKKVEYNGSVYTVVEIKGSPFPNKYDNIDIEIGKKVITMKQSKQ